MKFNLFFLKFQLKKLKQKIINETKRCTMSVYFHKTQIKLLLLRNLIWFDSFFLFNDNWLVYFNHSKSNIFLLLLILLLNIIFFATNCTIYDGMYYLKKNKNSK